MAFRVIAACEESCAGIGLRNALPWNLPDEAKYFNRATESTRDPLRRNALILGRETWLSVGGKAFPRRKTVVLTRNAAEHGAKIAASGCVCAGSFAEALSACGGDAVETVFICGGAPVYAEALSSPHCEAVLLTRIHASFDADTFFPRIDPAVYRLSHCSPQQVDSATGVGWHVEVFVRAKASPKPPPALPWWTPAVEHEEFQYLRLVADVLESGAAKASRAGPTLAKWGATMRFDLRDGKFPLLTTKRVFFRGVVEELLWFIAGSTSVQKLQQKGIHIWDANADPQFMRKACPSCDYEPGDLGPIYGFQWRHFGAEYRGMHADYSGQGVDQLGRIVDMLRHDPGNRRILLSAWNPCDLSKMALPPCPVLTQFAVFNGELHTMLYQRSADLGVGVPFDIASYALLTIMLAHVAGLRPCELVYALADTHVYSNHIEALHEQLSRSPKPFPRLSIVRAVDNIDSFTFEDFKLEGYDPWPAIKMVMNP